ncbi:MAG: phosphoribosylamine--glycine ligase [Armatimonadetes bacterium]|nr:phosphoribosylamine--glycine ligase [Armatimonadota bacterium]
MKVLVVGSGGREHALVWKLQQEGEVFCTPGSDAIAATCETYSVKSGDLAGLDALCGRLKPDLVVVGPEDPLIIGLADQLRKSGTLVLGPGEEGAQLEGSKAFSKALMKASDVPTAEFEVFRDAERASEYAHAMFDSGRAVAVKASGNALGKGVVVCSTCQEADEAIAMMLVDQEFGEAGATVVIEERLTGFEFSLLTLMNESSYHSLPVAQDHKRALDGDRGPNTGGMGTFSPVPGVSSDLVCQVEEEVVRRVQTELQKRQIGFRGVLFTGLMVDRWGPKVLEFNVRFGDPETQTVVRRLGSGFAEALRACAAGEPIPPVPVSDQAALTVVLASKGYPGHYVKGVEFALPPAPEEVVVFHAGTATQGSNWATQGGRVLGISSTGADLASARESAYRYCQAIQCDGLRYRTDIGSGTV